MTRSEHAIDVAGLLTIDVASELRKLSRAQLQGPWQLPAEIVRRAVRFGATRIDIQTARHRVRVQDDGSGLDVAHLQWAALLFDTTRSNEDRHLALTTLEECGQLVLLAVAGMKQAKLRLEVSHGGRRTLLDVQPGKAPRLATGSSELQGRNIVVELESPELDRRQMTHWLASAARFCPIAVSVDGKLLQDGLSSAMAVCPLKAPLSGRVAIVPDGETAHAWLLEHGLVTGHITLPEAPSFEAAVEMGSSENDLSAARLRDEITPLLPELVDQATAVLVELASRAPRYSEGGRLRIARLALTALKRRLHTAALCRAPIFRVIDAQGSRLVDLMTLRECAGTDPSGGKTLSALYPSQKPERFALGTSPVLIADEVERARLAELLGVRFRPPDAREAHMSPLAWGRRFADAASRNVKRGLTWMRHPLRAPVIPDARLTQEERALLAAIGEHLGGSGGPAFGARMCEGAGPLRRSREERPHLLLPRDNPDVVACVRAVARDPSWVYPALLVLLEGRSLPPPAARSRWARRG